MFDEKIFLRLVGLCFYIYGIVQLKKILKDKENPKFFYDNRYDITVIAIS